MISTIAVTRSQSFPMEGFGNPKFSAVSSVMKKKRSTTSRRPRPDSQFLVDGRDISSHSSTSDSTEQNSGYARRIASLNSIDGMSTSRKIRKEDRKYGDLSGFYGNVSNSKRCSEGVPALANWKSSGNSAGSNSGSNENKLKKVKLKVGGVTRTFLPKSTPGTDNASYNAKPSGSGDASRHRPKLFLQGNSDNDHTPAVKREGLPSEESLYGKQIPFSEPIRKSKRVPKRRVLDGDEGDGNDEIRHLEKLRASKVGIDKNSDLEDDGEESVKKKIISKVSKSKRVAYDVDDNYGLSVKDSRKKLRALRATEDTDYVEEEEVASDDVIDPKRNRQRKESVDTAIDARTEPLTTRQRALQSGKSASTGESLIEFPNGLPPVPPRKQKEKLSEVEQQAKKAEAAQRRRMQVEKANRESEAEAIRKILGQDSNRKKKEEKMRKERVEMAQKKAAESLVLAPNSIRWVMGPKGTIVTFGEDVRLPSIFEPKASSYPPPREKCVGPSCTNSYKYRDSKLNLPLCSLQCYKAVQEGFRTVSTS